MAIWDDPCLRHDVDFATMMQLRGERMVFLWAWVCSSPTCPQNGVLLCW
jgi:hypothetical protein